MPIRSARALSRCLTLSRCLLVIAPIAACSSTQGDVDRTAPDSAAARTTTRADRATLSQKAPDLGDGGQGFTSARHGR